MSASISTVWKPPVTHLMSDMETGKTLCGLEIETHKWDGGWSDHSTEDLKDRCCCSCMRCQAAGAKIAKAKELEEFAKQVLE